MKTVIARRLNASTLRLQTNGAGIQTVDLYPSADELVWVLHPVYTEV
jgi:hypothetical protein